MASSTSTKSDSHFERTSQFREVADRICAIAGKYVGIKGYHSPELPHYNELSVSKQTDALRLINEYLRCLQATEASGEELDKVDRSTWYALSTMGLVPPGDLFNRLQPDALVEIYDLDGLQIWRNFNFMKFCSYTLEEIYSLEWFNRYNRSEEKTKECLEKVGALLSGTTPDIFCPEIAEHTLEETCSQDMLRLAAKYEVFCRLKDRNGNLAAWLVMTSARVLGKAVKVEQQQRPQLSIVSPAI